MPDLFATETSYISELLALILFILLFSAFILIILLALVLAYLAALCLLGSFTAAPPHLPRVVTSMSPARPVVVFFLEVLLTALLAYLLVVLDPEPLVLELLYPLLELQALELRHFRGLVDLIEIGPLLGDLLVLDGYLYLQVADPLLIFLGHLVHAGLDIRDLLAQ